MRLTCIPSRGVRMQTFDVPASRAADALAGARASGGGVGMKVRKRPVDCRPVDEAFIGGKEKKNGTVTPEAVVRHDSGRSPSTRNHQGVPAATLRNCHLCPGGGIFR